MVNTTHFTISTPTYTPPLFSLTLTTINRCRRRYCHHKATITTVVAAICPNSRHIAMVWLFRYSIITSIHNVQQQTSTNKTYLILYPTLLTNNNNTHQENHQPWTLTCHSPTHKQASKLKQTRTIHLRIGSTLSNLLKIFSSNPFHHRPETKRTNIKQTYSRPNNWSWSRNLLNFLGYIIRTRKVVSGFRFWWWWDEGDEMSYLDGWEEVWYT